MYGFEIKLTRSIGPYILSVYLPSAMFVTMSWVSFVIPPVRFNTSLQYSVALNGNVFDTFSIRR